MRHGTRSRAACRWPVDVSVYLAGTERGRGAGRARTGNCSLRFGYRGMPGYACAFAGVTLSNELSVRLHDGLHPGRVFRAPASSAAGGSTSAGGSSRFANDLLSSPLEARSRVPVFSREPGAVAHCGNAVLVTPGRSPASAGAVHVACGWIPAPNPQPAHDSLLAQRLPSMLIVDPAAVAPHCVQHLLCTLEITDQELTCRFFRRSSCATAMVATECVTSADGIIGTHRFSIL